MIIRPLQPGDFPEWLRMRLILWDHYTPDEHRAEMELTAADRTCQTFVAARPNGGLGGFLEAAQRKYAEGCDTSPVGYIEGWFVDEDLRRQAVGSALVHAAEAWARQQGLNEIASDCLTDNLVSENAHKGLGYDEVERLIHFRKRLA